MTATVDVYLEDRIDVDIDFDDIDIDELLYELRMKYKSGKSRAINDFFDNYLAEKFDFNFTYYQNKDYAKEYFENSCPNYKNIIKFIKENY